MCCEVKCWRYEFYKTLVFLNLVLRQCLFSHAGRKKRAKVHIGDPTTTRRRLRHWVTSTGDTMRKFLSIFALLLGLALAAPMGLSGTVKTNAAIPNLRIGAFVVDRNNNPNRELVSVLGGSSFALTVPDAALAGGVLTALSSDSLDWPGLLGDVKISGTARAARVLLRGYSDNNKSGSFDGGDKLLETTLTRGRGNMVLVYAESRFRVQGDRGFDLTLEAGWNLVAIELGRTITTMRVQGLDNIQLEVFASQGY
jgi:hypothetical protein